jgi:integrase/recombinase XerD
MATLPIERPVTPHRQRMLDDMAMHRMGARTQHDYVRHVRAFAAFLEGSPDTATAEDVRRFQVHQTPSISARGSASPRCCTRGDRQ